VTREREMELASKIGKYVKELSITEGEDIFWPEEPSDR